jgi:hypothetical protein
MMKLTRKEYEAQLNRTIPNNSKPLFFVNGRYHETNKYGTLLRRLDPIAFSVSFNEWKRRHEQNLDTHRRFQSVQYSNRKGMEQSRCSTAQKDPRDLAMYSE